jgi:hypothetical protein
MAEEQIPKAGTRGNPFRTARPIRTVLELSSRLETDPALAEEIRNDPAGVIAKLAASPLETDVWIYRLVVGALGLTVLMAVGGSIYLATIGDGSEGRKVPEVIVAIGSAAVGALAGLLAPSPTRKAD